jgi:hypothetical protein
MSIVAASPGIHHRAALENRHLWNFALTPEYVKEAVKIGMEWLLNPAALLATFYACLFFRSRETAKRPDFASGWLVLMCLAGMSVVLLEFVGFGVVVGGLPPRGISWLHFLFWLFFFLLVLVGRETLKTHRQSTGLQMCLLVLLALALGPGSTNFRAAVSDVIGPARAWRQANAQRLQERVEDVQWAQLPEKPKLFMQSEVSADDTSRDNRCMANYLDVRSVAVVRTK